MIEYYCLNTWGDANRAWFNVRNIVVAALAGMAEDPLTTSCMGEGRQRHIVKHEEGGRLHP